LFLDIYNLFNIFIILLSIFFGNISMGIELNLPRLAGAAMRENLAPMVMSHLLNNYGIFAPYYELAPTVLRFELPLTVTKDQIDKAVDALDATLSKGIVGLGAAFGKSALGRMIKSPQ
jgi:putrescine aminotransferase